MLKATVSGSFHRHMTEIYAAVHELFARGVNVLSPADPRVVDFKGEFLFVASDKLRSVRLVQMRHFEAIRASDFLWIVCPDGYTGASTSAEIGAAYMAGTPIFSNHLPLDITIQEFVEVVPSIKVAAAMMRSGKTPSADRAHLLLNPEHSLEEVISITERLKPSLLGRPGERDGAVERDFDLARARIGETFGFRR